MAAHTLPVYVLILLLYEVSAKPAQNTSDSETNTIVPLNSTLDGELKRDFDDDIYNDTEEFNGTVNSLEATTLVKKACEVHNNTTGNDEFVNANNLNSIYLNNIYTRVTTNLIEEKVTVDMIEANGVNLYQVVNSDCGGAKVCPSESQNWTDEKTITIGFLGAYGRSPVSLFYKGIFSFCLESSSKMRY